MYRRKTDTVSRQITLTKEQFTHQWFFLQYFFPKEQREEIVKYYIDNRDQIDSEHDMEIIA